MNSVRVCFQTSGSTHYLFSPFAFIVAPLVCLFTMTMVSGEELPADPDFVIQGEYHGQLLGLSGQMTSHGLQVVANGSGTFTAVLLNGGFPGTGGDFDSRIRFTGSRDGNRVEIVSEDTRFFGRHFDARPGQWYFYDVERGQPIGTMKSIHRQSPTMHAQPPANARVLFDGVTINGLTNAEVDENNLLQEGFLTADPVRDFHLHLEFRTPWEPDVAGQKRGNSGVYIQTRYEVQILDSFGLDGAFNECGALYRQRQPDHNMALPPMQWQTYDIDFRAARFNDAGEKTENARISVRHNGIYVHRDVELPTKTGAGTVEGPDPLPIRFQDHSNPVRFRNMWIVDGGLPSSTAVVESAGASVSNSDSVVQSNAVSHSDGVSCSHCGSTSRSRRLTGRRAR